MFVADALDRPGAVTFDDDAPPGSDDSFPFGVRRESGAFLTSFAWYSEVAAGISVMAARHGISEDDPRAGVFLYRAATCWKPT
jgi:hypothetical protein